MDGTSSHTLSPAFNARADYTQILNYLCVQQTAYARADISLVFGNSRATKALAARAADFYHQGYFTKIIDSGGNINSDGLIEAHCIRDHLTRYGVPSAAILCDIFAENTQQNIENAQKLLAKRGLLKPEISVFCIGHIKAARRFLMTMARRWPQAIPILATAWEGNLPYETYIQQEAVERGIRAQYERIPRYCAQGFIREIDLKAVNARIKTLNHREFIHEPS